MGLTRTLLAITVVLAHSPWNAGFVFVGGKLAVQLFYMISGFLISHVIASNPAYLAPSRFYANRALRLFPTYWAVVFLAIVGTAIRGHNHFELYERLPTPAAILLFVSNFFLFGQDWVMFAAIQANQLVFASDFRNSEFVLYTGLLVPQAWSLGVELTFYLIAPFVLRDRRITNALLAISILIRCLLFHLGLGMEDPWSYRFFPAELALFLLGAISQSHMLPFWSRSIKSSRIRRLPELATGISIVVILLYFEIPGPELLKSILLIAFFFCQLPILFIFQNGSLFDKSIGELSYPVYVGHVLAMRLLDVFCPTTQLLTGSSRALANVLAALAFGCLLVLSVVKPVERLRARVRAAAQ